MPKKHAPTSHTHTGTGPFTPPGVVGEYARAVDPRPRMERRTFRLPASLIRDIKRVARARGMSEAQFVRYAITRAIASDTSPLDELRDELRSYTDAKTAALAARDDRLANEIARLRNIIAAIRSRR